MKLIWICVLCTFYIAKSIHADSTNTRIAILDFEEKAGKEHEGLADGLADVLEAHLSEAGFDVYERRQIRYVISERGLSRDGVTTIGKDEIAKLKHVTHLIQGRVEKLAGKQMRMNLEVIDTKKGTLLTAIQSEGEFPKGLEQINAKVTKELKRKLKEQPVSRKSRVVPGFPQSPEGAVYFYRGINAFIKKDYPAAISNFRSGLIINKDDYLHRHWIIKCYEQMGLYVSAGLHSDLLPKGKGEQQEYVSLRQKWSVYGLEHLSSQERANFKRALTAEAHIDIFEPKRITSVLSEKDLKYSGEFEEGVINDDHWLTSDRFLNFKKHEGNLSIEIIDSASGTFLAKIQPEENQKRFRFEQVDWKALGRLTLPENHTGFDLTLEELHVQDMLNQRFLNFMNGDYKHNEKHAVTADHSLIKKWHAIQVLKKMSVKHELVPMLLQSYDREKFFANYPFYTKKGAFYKKFFKRYCTSHSKKANAAWILKHYPNHVCSLFEIFNEVVFRSIEGNHSRAVELGERLERKLMDSSDKLNDIEIDKGLKVNFYYHYAKSLLSLNRVEKAKSLLQRSEPFFGDQIKPAISIHVSIRPYQMIRPRVWKFPIRVIKWSHAHWAVKREIRYQYFNIQNMIPEIKNLRNKIKGKADVINDSGKAIQLAIKDSGKAWEYLFAGLKADTKGEGSGFKEKQFYLLGLLFLMGNEAQRLTLKKEIKQNLEKLDLLHQAKIHFHLGEMQASSKTLKNLLGNDDIDIAYESILLMAYITYCKQGDGETNRFLFEQMNSFITKFKDKMGKRPIVSSYALALQCMRYFANTGRVNLASRVYERMLSEFDIDLKRPHNYFRHVKGIPWDVALAYEFERARADVAVGNTHEAVERLKMTGRKTGGRGFNYPYEGGVLNFKMILLKKLKYVRLYTPVAEEVIGKRKYVEISEPAFSDEWTLAIWLRNQKAHNLFKYYSKWVQMRSEKEVEVLYRLILSPPEFLFKIDGYFSLHNAFAAYFRPIFSNDSRMQQSIFECISRSFSRDINFIPIYRWYSKGYDAFIPATILAREMCDHSYGEHLLTHLLDHSKLQTRETTKIMLNLLSHPDEKIKINVGNKIIKSYNLKIQPMKAGEDHSLKSNEIHKATEKMWVK